MYLSPLAPNSGGALKKFYFLVPPELGARGRIKKEQGALPTCFFLAFGYRIEAIIRFTKIQDAEFKRNYVACSPDRLGCRRYSDEVLSRASRLRNHV